MQQTTTIFASYPHLQIKRLYNKRTVLIISTVRIFCIDQVLPLCHFPVARSKRFSCRSPDLSILILNRLPDFSVAALRLDLRLPNYSGGSVPVSHRLPSQLCCAQNMEIIKLCTNNSALKFYCQVSNDQLTSSPALRTHASADSITISSLTSYTQPAVSVASRPPMPIT